VPSPTRPTQRIKQQLEAIAEAIHKLFGVYSTADSATARDDLVRIIRDLESVSKELSRWEESQEGA